MPKSKNIAKFESALARAMEVNPAGAGKALQDCAKHLRRIATRAQETPEDMTHEVIEQTRGPWIEFIGREIANFSSQRPGKDRWQEAELWETRGGAYVAVLSGMSDADNERDQVKATVIEPSDDEDARRISVMDALSWSEGAVRMVHDQLKWDLRQTVD